MSIGSKVKSRVVNWILAVLKRDLDKITRRKDTLISEVRYLRELQHSLKTADYPSVLQIETVILEHEARLDANKLSENYLHYILIAKILFAKIIIQIFTPFSISQKSGETFAAYIAIGKTNQFLLDLFLPPDRAEETSTALQDVCQSRWEKRYRPRKVAFLCFVHTVSTIYSHHAVRFRKLGSLVLGIAGLTKTFAKFWET